MIKAVADKIVVEEMKRTKSKGGIILPENSVDPQAYGKILSMGEDVKNLKVGDIIVFHQRGGQAALIGRKLIRVLTYNEIYGILEDKDTMESLVELEIAGVSEEDTKIRPASKLIHPVS